MSNPKSYQIRWCTGGCANGEHAPHVYSIDPVDGPLGRECLCPGNIGECREYLDDNGEPTGWGFIPETKPRALSMSVGRDHNYPLFGRYEYCIFEDEKVVARATGFRSKAQAAKAGQKAGQALLNEPVPA